MEKLFGIRLTHASGYKVQLYKNGSKQGSEVALGTGATSYDFTSQIAESGTYTFKVWATGDDSVYGDSEKDDRVEPMYFPSRP